MNAKAMLSTLAVLCFIIFAATTAASQPGSRPWLAVLSYPCRRSAKTCIEVILDDHWVLTTASCFSKCNKIETPLQLSVYINIPSEVQGRLALSMHMGDQVNGSLVWQHPDFNSSTFANNLALIQLDCRTRSLEKLSLATNCSVHDNQQIKFNGFVFAKRSAIKIKNTKADKAKCFGKEGTDTWYHLDNTLQMLTTKLRPSCMETSIYNNSEWLISVMQGNKLDCTENLSSTTLAPVKYSDAIYNDTVPKPIPTIDPSIIHDPEENDTASQLISKISTEKAATSTEISEASTSLKAQVATSTKMQTTTEASTSSLMPTPTSTVISTSILVSSSSLTSSSVVADTLTITTPTKIPTSGCQLSIENGVATPSWMDGFLIITYTCNVEYRFKTGTGPITVGCTNGEMVARPLPCELIVCPPVEPIANGRVVVSGSGLSDSATYSCNEGYVLFHGYTVRRCTGDLEWDGYVGICKQLCNEKQRIANAKIVIHRNASSYTRTIICDDGYEADGFAEQHCTIYGQWTPHFQKCMKMCSSIAIDNGIVERRKSSGHNVIKCDKGFVWSHLLKNFMLHVLMDNGYPASLAVLKTNRYGISIDD